MDTYDSDKFEEEPETNSGDTTPPENPEPDVNDSVPPYVPGNPLEASPESYGYAEQPPPLSLEPINPWIGIVTQPRATIRYILDSGKWNNIWAIYAIIFAMMIPIMILSMLMQPPSQQLPPGMDQSVFYGIMVGMAIGMVVIGYPIGMLIIYLYSYLFKVAGGWLDGVGTTSDLRIAFTWSYVASLYLNIIMIIPYGLIAYSNYTTDSADPARQIIMSLIVMAISLPVTIIYMIIASKCIGETHRFSAWRGLGTILLAGLIMFGIMMGIVIGLFVLIVGIMMLAGA